MHPTFKRNFPQHWSRNTMHSFPFHSTGRLYQWLPLRLMYRRMGKQSSVNLDDTLIAEYWGDMETTRDKYTESALLYKKICLKPNIWDISIATITSFPQLNFTVKRHKRVFKKWRFAEPLCMILSSLNETLTTMWIQKSLKHTVCNL